jgi:protease I
VSFGNGPLLLLALGLAPERRWVGLKRNTRGFVSPCDRKEETMASLNGKNVAFLAADGFEEVELTEPWKAIEQSGGKPELVSIKTGKIYAMNHHDKAGMYKVDKTVDQVSPRDYDALVLPGGVINPDILRTNKRAVEFVRGFFTEGKPVGAICHGPWTLVEANVVRGRTLTSWPSLHTDIRNAGGTWVDEQVHVDNGLVTSRKPDDLPAFNKKLIEEISEGVHKAQAELTKKAS